MMVCGYGCSQDLTLVVLSGGKTLLCHSIKSYLSFDWKSECILVEEKLFSTVTFEF